jgi:uncharacterized protein with FMN-binding domain
MFPKRGAFAVFITVVALVALLAYKTPELSTPGDPAAYFDVPADQSALIAVADISAGPDASSAVDVWATGQPSGAAGSSPAASAAPGTPGQPATPGSTANGATPPPAQPPTPGSTPRPVSGATLPPTTKPPTLPPTAAPPAPPTAAPPKPTPAPGFTGTIDGTVVNMKYGPVQVRVVFSNGKITDVQALQTPTADSKSVSIAQHAVPILRSEALAAQSASISSVSGATYTSAAYKSSLQAAISKA